MKASIFSCVVRGLEEGRRFVETQFSLGLLGIVATDAVEFQNRLNVADKVDFGLVRTRRRTDQEGGGGKGKQTIFHRMMLSWT